MSDHFIFLIIKDKTKQNKFIDNMYNIIEILVLVSI